MPPTEDFSEQKSLAATRSALLRKLLHFEDWLHFQRIGEISHASFRWWHLKYRSHLDQVSAKRAWLRTKNWLKDLKIDHEIVNLPHDPGLGVRLTSTGEVQIRAWIDALIKYPHDEEKQLKYAAWRRKYYRTGDKMRERYDEWYAKHRSERLRYLKEYNRKNKDRIAAQKKSYREENKEQVNARINRWKNKNRAHVSAMEKKYVEDRKNHRWAEIVKAKGDRCCECGESFPFPVYDICVPKGVAGRDGPRAILKNIGKKRFQELLPSISIRCANCSRLVKAGLI